MDALLSVFHHFQIVTTDSTHMQSKSKSMNFIEEEKIESMFGEED